MSPPSTQPQLALQVQAVLNRLQVRLGSGLAEVAASLLTAAEQTPGRLGREWELFWQEVEMESERLARGHDAAADPAPPPPAADGSGAAAANPPAAGGGDPQDLIDSLRARVAGLSHKLDA